MGNNEAMLKYKAGQITLAERLRWEFEDFIRDTESLTSLPYVQLAYIDWLSNRVWSLECEIATLKKSE